MTYEYDYARFEGLVKQHLEVMWRDEDNLEIGEDICDIPQVKIIFDGYGDLETEDDYIEGGDKNSESYAIFIHKDALVEGFEFPPHDLTPWALIHRTQEEVCLYAWYNVEEDYWDILPLEDRVDDTAMKEEDVMNILEGLNKIYFEHTDVELVKAEWPFPTKQ